MKKMICISLLSLLSFFNSYGQEDYLDIIAKKACECIESRNLHEIENQEAATNQLGICLLDASKDYREALLRDHQLDLNKLDMDGEKLGVLIGSRMAFVCAETLMSVAETEQTDVILSEGGEITAVEESPFVVFTLKDSSGKSSKFYWLTFVDSNLDLQNSFSQLKGRKVSVEYMEQELFDPRLKEYRMFNLIVGLYSEENR